MAEQYAVELTISGQVTAVNYRNWAQAEAARLGLTGWVRNNIDRTVTVFLEGDQGAIEQFTQLARRGPDGAVVEDIRSQEAEARGLAAFTVEY